MQASPKYITRYTIHRHIICVFVLEPTLFPGFILSASLVSTPEGGREGEGEGGREGEKEKGERDRMRKRDPPPPPATHTLSPH